MVTIYTGKQGLSRRELLKRGGVGALLVVTGSAVNTNAPTTGPNQWKEPPSTAEAKTASRAR